MPSSTGRSPSASHCPSERSLQVTLGVGPDDRARGAASRSRPRVSIGRGAGGWRSVAAPSLQTPLREALVQLIELDRVRVGDLLDLRLILEPAAVERAAQVRDRRRAGARARDLESTSDTSIGRGGTEVGAFREADVAFHVALAEASGTGRCTCSCRRCARSSTGTCGRSLPRSADLARPPAGGDRRARGDPGRSRGGRWAGGRGPRQAASASIGACAGGARPARSEERAGRTG